MSPYSLVTLSLSVITVCVVIIGAFFLALFVGSLLTSNQKSFTDRIKNKGVLFSILVLGAALGLAVCALLFSGIWLLSIWFFEYGSPAWLAALSVGLGLAPLIISRLAATIARLLGGRVDASGAYDCLVFGFDLGPVLHSVFMAYFFSFFTMGLGFIGLVVSAVWAV